MGGSLFGFSSIACSNAFICHGVELKGDIYLNKLKLVDPFMKIDEITISNIRNESCGLLISGNLYAGKIEFNICNFHLYLYFIQIIYSDGFFFNYLSNINSTLGFNWGVKIHGNMVFEDLVVDSII